MTKLTVDAVTLAKLGNLNGPLELHDESGRLLGFFTPASAQSFRERAEPLISDEELRRRSARSGGRLLSEIMSDLGSNAI